MLDMPSQWTTAGKTRGLDPLGMLGPIEQLYQKGLLPGFSSVTTRIRYYSFHAWWLTRYADAEGGQSTSSVRFEDHTRRVEALFALAGLAANPNEVGLAGYYFARDKLAESSEKIDFRKETDRQSAARDRYIDPLGGAFPGIYAGQMTEIGLLSKAEHHDLPVPTNLGRRLAAVFGNAVKGLGEHFLAIADKGIVSISELGELAVFSPSRIDPEGDEAELLRTILMGYEGPEEHRSCRGASLRAILQTAVSEQDAHSVEKISTNSLRWAWLADLETTENDIIRLWAAYQAGDVLRTSYEALLRHLTLLLEDYPDGRTLSDLIEEVSETLSGQTFQEWLQGIEDTFRNTTFEDLQKRSLAPDASLAEMVAPIARLTVHWSGKMEVLADAYPPSSEEQTIFSELSLFDECGQEPADRAIASILDMRIIRRHLRVATRKFHGQGNYTFLIEPESGRLRARETRSVEASGPRLDTALTFLDDLDLLKDGQITPRGRLWMHEPGHSVGEPD